LNISYNFINDIGRALRIAIIERVVLVRHNESDLRFGGNVGGIE
jgi:hypothetical protein